MSCPQLFQFWALWLFLQTMSTHPHTLFTMLVAELLPILSPIKWMLLHFADFLDAYLFCHILTSLKIGCLSINSILSSLLARWQLGGNSILSSLLARCNCHQLCFGKLGHRVIAVHVVFYMQMSIMEPF